LLGKKWILVFLIILLAAILIKQVALLVVAILFVLTSGIARLWSRYALQRLEYNREVSAKKVFWGETITLDLTLTNSKFLPLPWVNVEEIVPEDVTYVKGNISEGDKPGEAIFSGFFTLSWYHRLTRRYPLRCNKRGVFSFGPTEVRSGDPFGFFQGSFSIDKRDQLMVYPRILPLQEVNIPSRHPFGDLRLKRHLFEDPVQVMTTRDYVAGDPMKRIHWKSSARVGILQSRVFEYTTTMDMAVFMDTRTISSLYYYNEVATDLLETGILVATAIASYCTNNDFKIGLYTNEFFRNTNRLIRLPPSENKEQFKQILESLAYIRGVPFLTIDKLVSKEARQLGWETTMVIITAVLTDELIATIKYFQKVGRRICLILIGKRARVVRLEGVTVYHVTEEVYQKQVESLQLEPVA